MGYATTNPATGDTEREFPSLTSEQVDEHVQGAHDAFEAWRDRPVEERTALVGRVGELMAQRREELAQLATREMGKRIDESRAEVDLSASIFAYYAQQGAALLADRPYEANGYPGEAKVVSAPIGPIVGVMPWNFPYYQVARLVAPNIVLGNTILLKHASINPQCAAAIQRLFDDAQAPSGVYSNLFCGSDEIERIIDSPLVAGVSLTGSEPAGRSVAEAAGRNLKKVVLELGGSDPFVVLDGDHLDATVDAAVWGRMQNTGQSCVASKRFIVLEDVYDAFLEQFARRIGEASPGDPADAATTLGPLSSPGAIDLIEEQVDDAVAHGATVVVGGHRIDRPGNYFEATVLTDVGPDARAYGEELFGPVAVVYRVPDEEAAIALANDSTFGLGGSVIASDLDRAQRVAARIDTGMVWINHPTGTQADLPFGGTKDSGIGRELADLGINEFVNQKLIRTLPAGSAVGQADG